MGFDAARGAHELMAHFVIGYPGQGLGYVLSESGNALARLDTRWATVSLVANDGTMEALSHRRYLKSEKMNLNPEGLSGAPVFSLYRNEECCHLALSGIVTHASKAGLFAIYPAEAIQEMLNDIVADLDDLL